MSLTQAGRQTINNQNQANPITNPDGNLDMRPQKIRVPASQYTGQRMDEIMGTQVNKEYQKVQNQQLSQTIQPRTQQEQQIPDRLQISDTNYQRVTNNNQQNPRAAPLQPAQQQFQQRPQSYQAYDQSHSVQDFRQKVTDQDRMIQYLMDQVQNLDRTMANEMKKIYRNQLEFKAPESNINNQLITELENKLFNLESRFVREEKAKNEIHQKFLLQEQNLKELMYLIKNLQSRDNNDMLQMRGILQEKITEEGVTLAKEREKSKALFMEVVRLGEQSEKVSESLVALNMQYEQRLQSMENKIYSGEKALMSVAQKGDNGIAFLNDWNEKLDKRIMMLESNVLTLGKEQLKDRDKLSIVETAQQRLQEDLKQMIYSVQQEFQSKLEARSTELVNRIVMEHEQRVRVQDEMKINFDTREKLNNERQQYEREEMRERIQTIEQIFRADSTRKDEAIRQLGTLLETQVAAIYTNIKNEEAQRYTHEVALRNDLLKIQENIKQENDLFKAHQTAITEKITDMIKVEVQNRLSSDVDLKNLTSAIAQDIVADLNSLKDSIDSQNSKFIIQLKEIEKDSAERSEKLSLYVDEEVSKLSGTQLRKYEKMKIIFTKLAEQFKQHLINTEQSKQEVEGRLKSVEVNFENIRGDFQVVLEDLQLHLLTKMADDKNEIIKTTASSIKTIEDKTNKLEDEQNRNFQILKEAIEENHDIFTEKMKLIIEQNEVHQREAREQIMMIVSGVQAVRESISELENQLREQLNQMQEKVDSINTQFESFETRIQENSQKLSELSAQIDTLNGQIIQINEDMEKVNEESRKSKERMNDIIKVSEDIKEEITLLKETQEKLNESHKNLTNQITNMEQIVRQTQLELDAVQKAIMDLQEEDKKTNNRINDEVLAQMLKEREDAQAFIETINDKTKQMDERNLKQDIQLKEVQENIEILQQKVQTLVRLEN